MVKTWYFGKHMKFFTLSYVDEDFISVMWNSLWPEKQTNQPKQNKTKKNF